MNPWQEFFVKPFIERTGYNAVNTLVYGVLFILFILVVYRVLKLLKVSVDDEFLVASLPFVFLAGVVRSLTDQGVYAYHALTVSPGIYLTITFITVGVLAVSKLVEKFSSVKYYEFMSVAGAALAGSQIVLLRFNDLLAFAQTISLFLTLTIPTILLVRKYDVSFLNNYYAMMALLGQYLDASATAVAVGFHGFWEQHVLTRWVFDLTGSAFSMIPVKALAGVLIVYAIHQWEEKEEFRNFLYFAMIILGWGPGLRDVLSALAF